MTDKFEGRARMLEQLEKSAYAKGRADERADTCTLLAKWERARTGGVKESDK